MDYRKNSLFFGFQMNIIWYNKFEVTYLFIMVNIILNKIIQAYITNNKLKTNKIKRAVRVLTEILWICLYVKKKKKCKQRINQSFQPVEKKNEFSNDN